MITEHQWKIYVAWIDNDQKIKPTAIALQIQPEKVRQAVAAVQRKLANKKLPTDAESFRVFKDNDYGRCP
jgi:hypothetical protein